METQKFLITVFDRETNCRIKVTPPMTKELIDANFENLSNDLRRPYYDMKRYRIGSGWSDPEIIPLPNGCPEKLSDLKPGQKVKHTKENEIRILEITDVLCDDDYFGYAEIIDSEGERNRIYPTDLADIQIIEE